MLLSYYVQHCRTRGFVLGLSLLLTIFYFIPSQDGLIEKPHITIRTSCYHDLGEVLQERSFNQQIVLTMVNYAYIDLAMHWTYRLRRLGVNNFFIHALDSQSAAHLQQYNLSSVCYFNAQNQSVNQTTYALWGSAEFKNIGNTKLILTNQILKLNYSIIVSEIDVIWFANLNHQLQEYSQQYDVIAQGNQFLDPMNRRNIGFFYLPARPAAKEIMNEVEAILLKDPSIWDQVAFNQVVDRAVEKKKVKDLLLNNTAYAFENFFLDPKIPMDQTVMAHLVGLDSAAAKTFVIKERVFSEDVFGYLSGPRKYLTYNNPSIDPNAQIEQLKKALHLSVVLNRTLILPRFQCNHMDYYNAFHKTKLSFNCTAERLVSIEHLNAKFSIRENSFLANPLVPPHIRSSYASYQMTCNGDERKKEKAAILNVGDLDCFTAPVHHITIRTCPPSNLRYSENCYGSFCK